MKNAASDPALRLLVMSMWPSAAYPEFGVFVRGQVSALRKLGADVHVAKLREQRSGKIRTPLKYLRLSWDAQTIAGDFQSQILHGHYLLPTGWVTRRVARKMKLPYAVTAHGSDVTNCEQSPKLRKRTEKVVREAACVFAVSPDLSDRLKALFPGLEPHVSHMGVDTDIFQWQQHGGSRGSQKGPLVVAVGALTQNKNHETLIRAVASLSDVRLVILGEGAERSRLETVVEELDVRSRIALAGRVPLYDLPSWYARADACALVSLSEGFGLAPLEGAACGTRPVVSAGLPVAKVLEEAGAGVATDPTSVEAVAAAIQKALDLGRLDEPTAKRALLDQDTSSRAQVVLDALTRSV